MRTHAQTQRQTAARTSSVIGSLSRRGWISPHRSGLQAKLTVGRSGDRYEQEADRVAEAVTSPGWQTFPAISAPAGHAPDARPLQRMCSSCEEEHLQRRSPHERAAGVAQPVPPEVHDVLRSPGQPLDARTRAELEPRFGYDFSHVRVHTDSTASASARAVDALAYTVGRNIVFGAGSYAPETAAGQRLLAHELTHVVQQRAALASSTPVLGQPGDRLEREADRAADRVTAVSDRAGGVGSIGTRAATALLQRKPTAKEAKASKLLRLAVFPAEALEAWKQLSQADRDTILWEMILRYDAGFSADFLEYAKGTKKPNPGVQLSNSPDLRPKALTARGYRLAEIRGGIPHWVHPSGQEVMVLPPAKPASPEPEADDRQARCADPCMDKTEDEDACNKCCDDSIPEDDQPCRRTCHISCSMKL